MKEIDRLHLRVFALLLLAFAANMALGQTVRDSVTVVDIDSFNLLATPNDDNFQFVSRKNGSNARVSYNTMRSLFSPDVVNGWTSVNTDTTGQITYLIKFVKDTQGRVWFTDLAGDRIVLEDTTGVNELRGLITVLQTGDTSSTNEIQTLSVASTSGGYNITLSPSGGTVFVPSTDDQTASEVSVTDTGGNFTGTNVEDVLAELAAADPGGGISNLVEDTTPQLGGDLDGQGNAITNIGNVDGRDVSADGTKLDGIESGATADQTGAEIVTSINTELGGTTWQSGGSGSTTVQGKSITIAAVGNSIAFNATTGQSNGKFSKRVYSYDSWRDSIGWLVTDTIMNGGAPLNCPSHFIGDSPAGIGQGIFRLEKNFNYVSELAYNYVAENPYDTVYVLPIGRGGKSFSDSLFADTYYRDSILLYLEAAKALDPYHYSHIDLFVVGGYPGENNTLESKWLEFKDSTDLISTNAATTWFFNDAPTSYTEDKWNHFVKGIISHPNGQAITAYALQDSLAASHDGVHPDSLEIEELGKAAYVAAFTGRNYPPFAETSWRIDYAQWLSATEDNYVLTYNHALQTASFEVAPGAGGGISNLVEDTTPQLGGDLDGQGNAITNIGNVDGRDVSADGTKLDGIESGATADQTGAEIVTSINTELGGTTWQSGGGGGGGTTVYYFGAVDTSTTTIALQTWTDVSWNVEQLKDNSYTHSTTVNPEQITLDSSGTYLISTTINFQIATFRQDGGIRLQVDTGSGFVDLPNGIGYATFASETFDSVISLNKRGVSMASTMYQATAGNIIKVQAYMENIGDWSFIPGSNITIQRIR